MKHSTESQNQKPPARTISGSNENSSLANGSWNNFYKRWNKKTPVSLRLNPKKCQTSPFEGSPLPWCPQAYYLEERPIFTLDPLSI